MLIHIPDIPWKPFDGCSPGSVFSGRVLAYPSRKRSEVGKSWLRGEYDCVSDVAFESNLLLPRAGDSLGIVLAASTGKRDLLSPEMTVLFRSLGLSHLLVISGFHFSVVLASILCALRFLMGFNLSLFLNYSLAKVSLLAAYSLSISYIVTIDAGLPAQRALVAAGVMVWLKISERDLPALSCVFMVALILIFAYPSSIVEPSFILSFSAVLGIVFCGKFLKSLKVLGRLPANRFLRYLMLSGSVSVFAWSFSAPAVIYYFKSICLIAPLVNLFIAPLFSLLIIVGGGFFLLVYSLVPEWFLGSFKLYLEFIELFLDLLWLLGTYLPLQSFTLSPNASRWAIFMFLVFDILLVIQSLKLERSIVPLSLRGN
jgi:ComEC/Rec2-related protein